jgi:hypothetical protein
MNTDFAGGETIGVYLRTSAAGSYLWEGRTIPVQGFSDKFSDGNNAHPAVLVETNRMHILGEGEQDLPYLTSFQMAKSPCGHASHPAILCQQVRDQVGDYSSLDKLSRPTRG